MALRDFIDHFTSDFRKVDWGRTVLLVLLVLAIFSSLWQYLMPQIRTITSTEFRRVNQIRTVDKIQRVTVPGPERIVTIEKEKIVENLVLPPEVVADPNKQVVATGDLPPSEAGFETATVMDMETGESFDVAQEKELPFFQFTKELEGGAYYGLATEVGQIAQATLRYSFMRTGPLKWDLKGELNTRPEAKALVGFHLDLLK